MRARVTRIEPAHEADHRGELWMARGHRLDALAILDVERQRFFDEDVLASLERGDGLIGMQRGRGDQHHGVELWIAHEGVEVLMQRSHAEFAACPVELGGHRAAGADELRAARAQGQLLSVALAQTAEAGDADLQGNAVRHGRAQNSTALPDFAPSVAASASFCAATPSATVVLNGWP